MCAADYRSRHACVLGEGQDVIEGIVRILVGIEGGVGFHYLAYLYSCPLVPSVAFQYVCPGDPALAVVGVLTLAEACLGA